MPAVIFLLALAQIAVIIGIMRYAVKTKEHIPLLLICMGVGFISMILHFNGSDSIPRSLGAFITPFFWAYLAWSIAWVVRKMRGKS